MISLSLLKPRYWLLWVGIGVLWCVTRLPYRWQIIIGQQLGRFTYKVAKRRRHIAAVNLKLCFPELNDTQRHDLLHQHFESLGIGLIEVFSAWWLPDSTVKFLGYIEGFEHLQAALERKKGVILFSAHFTSFELGARLITMQIVMDGVYRPHENLLIEYLMKKNRENHVEKAIPRDAVREMLRSLKSNKALWLATDQNFGHKSSVFADFFGVPAATNTTISRLARVTGAAVVPFFTQRLKNYQGYKVILQPALEHFPSEDDGQDALRINQLIEAQIRQAPEQYLWVHRRFKDRLEGEESFY